MKNLILTVFIFLTACGENELHTSTTSTLTNTLSYNSTPSTPTNTPVHNSTPSTPTNTPVHNSTNNENNLEGEQTETLKNFEAGILFDLTTYEDQLSESELPLLDVIEKNLTALVEYDHTLYNSGFEHENLWEAMKYYYSEDYKYKFTDIESIESYTLSPKHHRVHIYIIGQRLDTTSDTIDDIKMMYAMVKNDQGEWVIHTID